MRSQRYDELYWLDFLKDSVSQRYYFIIYVLYLFIWMIEPELI